MVSPCHYELQWARAHYDCERRSQHLGDLLYEAIRDTGKPVQNEITNLLGVLAVINLCN